MKSGQFTRGDRRTFTVFRSFSFPSITKTSDTFMTDCTSLGACKGTLRAYVTAACGVWYFWVQKGNVWGILGRLAGQEVHRVKGKADGSHIKGEGCSRSKGVKENWRTRTEGKRQEN